MKVNISSNLCNGVGLQRDYLMLRGELERRGHEVHGVEYNQADVPAADLVVFLELINVAALDSAPRRWVIPNPDWWHEAWAVHFPIIERVLAKTRDCERIFRQWVGDRCSYLGWRTGEFYDATVPRERKFLHLAGKSQMKNTPAVLACWRDLKPDADLTVLSQHFCGPAIPRVTYRDRVDDKELRMLLNSHRFHICPSAYEGYGYALHEALAAGAVLITSDQPPMNQCGAHLLVPTVGKRPWNACFWHEVSPQGVFAAVQRALAMGEDDVLAVGDAARRRVAADNEEFAMNLTAVVGQ